MKRIFIFIFSLISLYTQAQTITVKQPNGTETIFNRLDSAIYQSPSGSTYFLSGGIFPTFSNSVLSINKQVNIIGAGYAMDSTAAIGMPTLLTGHIYLGDGADNSIFQGFDLNGNSFEFANLQNGFYTKSKVKNVLIKRVKFGSIGIPVINNNINETNYNVSNIMISECIFNSGNFGRCANLKIINNVIFSNSQTFINPVVENNIFLYGGTGWSGSAINECYGGIFKNNIHIPGQTFIYNPYGYHNLQNNLQIGVNPFIPMNVNPIYLSGNLGTTAIPADIFVKYQGTPNLQNIHEFDFHIKPNTIAKNAGTDGKDLGIYGGDGFRAIPAIPWIEYKNVAKQTNNQGQLPINFRVKAKN
jgi:hypothetical protein